jgi:hypothetical protein
VETSRTAFNFDVRFSITAPQDKRSVAARASMLTGDSMSNSQDLWIGVSRDLLIAS